MNYQTITLGDNTVVQLAVDPNGKVVTLTSANPIFVFAVGDFFQIDVGTFTSNVFGNLAYLMEFIYSQPRV